MQSSELIIFSDGYLERNEERRENLKLQILPPRHCYLRYSDLVLITFFAAESMIKEFTKVLPL
jgi:hypothetical protein